MQKYNKSRLMQVAASLRKTGLSLAQSLKQAWFAMKLRAKMVFEGVVNFAYAKEDGSIRQAVGTLQNTPPTKGTGAESPVLILKYFDVTANGWRSCRIDRLALA